MISIEINSAHTDLRERLSGRLLSELFILSYKCNKPGHLARDCEGEAVCRNCGQSGHIAHDCKNEPVCRKCGRSGHIARNCSQ